MKKLSIMAIIVCFAMFANAASFSWKLQTGLDYVGMNVYAVTDSTASIVLAALQSGSEEDWSNALEGFTMSVSEGTNARAGAIGESTGVIGDTKLVFVIVDGNVVEGSQFWVLNDYSIPGSSVFVPPATGTAVTIKVADQGIAGTGTFTATAVPEPASAMLALAGVAMLIRRRK